MCSSIQGRGLGAVTLKLANGYVRLRSQNVFTPAASGLSSFCSKETAEILVQLCLWSEIGVLTRIYLGRLFNGGRGNGWGLCLTYQRTRDKQYGAVSFDLPASMLGCLFMGFLSTASVLGLKSMKSLAFLPAHSCLQDKKELQVGLRTGYCGSLTTFASWEVSLLQLLIGSKGGGGGQWQQWLWGHIIGFELAFASHLVGQHAALGLHRWLLRDGVQDPVEEELSDFDRPTEPQEEGQDSYGSNEANEVFGTRHRPGTAELEHGGASGNTAESHDLDQHTEVRQGASGNASSYQHPYARQQQGSDLEDESMLDIGNHLPKSAMINFRGKKRQEVTCLVWLQSCISLLQLVPFSALC